MNKTKWRIAITVLVSTTLVYGVYEAIKFGGPIDRYHIRNSDIVTVPIEIENNQILHTFKTTPGSEVCIQGAYDPNSFFPIPEVWDFGILETRNGRLEYSVGVLGEHSFDPQRGRRNVRIQSVEMFGPGGGCEHFPIEVEISIRAQKLYTPNNDVPVALFIRRSDRCWDCQ